MSRKLTHKEKIQLWHNRFQDGIDECDQCGKENRLITWDSYDETYCYFCFIKRDWHNDEEFERW